MTVDAKLYDYATPRQKEFLDAIEQYGSATAANKALGLSTDVVTKSMRRLRAHAAQQGYAPGHFEHGVAPGYAMGKVTVQRGPDGLVERTWERQSPDRQNLLEALEAAVDAMAGRIVPAAPIPTVGNHHDD